MFNKYSIGAAGILIAAAILALASVWHDAPIVDEDPHIGAAYSYIVGHTYEFNPEHPPLAKDLAGIALSFLNIPKNFLTNYDASHPGVVNDQWNFGRQLIYHSGVDPILLVHTAKTPMILFFLFSGWLIFLWAKRTYNERAALMAVFLFSFSPTIIAHSRLVTTDIPALFGVLFASYFFLRYLLHSSRSNFIWASLAFGIALLTKFSTFLLVPYFIILALVWGWVHGRHHLTHAGRELIKAILIMVVGFIFVVGPVYAFHIQNYPAARQKQDTIQTLQSFPGHIANMVIWASDKSILRPYAQYGLGLTMVTQRASGGNRTYFLGSVSSTSFKSYFPIVFALKEPIPFLILLFAGLYFGISAWRRNHHESLAEKLEKNFLAFAMLLWIAIYGVTSISSNLNIGIRHLMPIYGFLFILTAGTIEHAINHRPRFRKAVAVLLVWYLAECLAVYPFYLTYFNKFAGGPSGGYRYVADSNLDWGQDLWRLGDYIKANNIQKIYVDYFGWAEQEFYLGQPFVWLVGGTYTNANQFFAANPNGGWIAVSGTYYDESSTKSGDNYYWLKAYKPTAVIGHSIFVWHLTR
jgi:4-amino-4-deoxy-L-arabinose transferase-like glycosyltransferase